MQPRGWGNHAQISNTPHRTCSTISLYAFLSERAHDLIIPEARSKKLSSVKLTNKDACEKKKSKICPLAYRGFHEHPHATT